MYMVKSDKIKNKSNMFARVNEVMLLMSWRHQNVMLNFFHISLLLSVNIMHFLTLEVMLFMAAKYPAFINKDVSQRTLNSNFYF